MTHNPRSSIDSTLEKPRRHWYQFSLNFLLAMTLISAVGVSAWMQWEQNRKHKAEMAKIVEEMKRSKQDGDFPPMDRRMFQYYQFVGALMMSLDVTNPKHRDALAMLQRIHDVNGFSGKTETKRVWEKSGDFIVVVIRSKDGLGTTRRAGTVVALVRNEKEVIDWVVRPSGSESETWHEINLGQVTQPAESRLVFDCYPNGQNRENAFIVIYRITEAGFEKINK